MKIAIYLIRYPGYGGIERVTTMLSGYFVSKGVDVSVISYLQQDEEHLLGDMDSRIQLYRMPNFTDWNASENAIFLKKICAEGLFDLILYQDSYANIEHNLFAATASLNTKLVVCEHNTPLYAIKARQSIQQSLSFLHFPMETLRKLGYFYSLYKIGRAGRQRRQFLLHNCDKYVLLSQQFIPEFLKVAHVSFSDKLTFINNPSMCLSNGTQVLKNKELLFVGQIIPTKGIMTLLTIWMRIADKFQDWRFTIVGDGSQRKDAELFVSDHHIERVSFEGYQSNVAPYYQRASIFTMASIFEGWPMVLIEAMSVGCVPIAFTTFSSVTDVITNNVNGVLVQAKNMMEYQKQLEQMMSSPQRLVEMAAYARQKPTDFTIEKIGTQWLKLFDSLVKK